MRPVSEPLPPSTATMPSIRLQIRRSCTQSAQSNKPTGVGAQASSAAPMPANNTLSIEIWFGVIDVFDNAEARRCAQALPRVAIGRRFKSGSAMFFPIQVDNAVVHFIRTCEASTVVAEI